MQSPEPCRRTRHHRGVVIPISLSGLWKSIFARNKQVSIPFARLFPTVRLNVGNPVAPALATPDAIRAAVMALQGDRR